MIYSRRQAADALQARGFPAIAQMIEMFERPVELDKELGLGSNAHNWYALRSMPSKAAENLARLWLDRNLDRDPETADESPACDPEETAPKTVDTTFLVICPPEVSTKVQKVLGILGCEIEAL